MTWCVQPYGWDGKKMRPRRFGERELAERAADRIIVDQTVQSIFVTFEPWTLPDRGNGRFR